MSERVILQQIADAGSMGHHAFINAERGPKAVAVDVYPGVDREHNPTSPETLCDRVKVRVGQAGSGDHAGSRDYLVSTFEMTVTEPPRTAEEFATLAQRLADIAVGHADQVFALY